MIPDTNRLILHTVAILGILGLGFRASPAVAQMAPWQQPPGANRSDRNSLPEGDGTSAPAVSNLDGPDRSPTPWTGEDHEQESGALGLPRGVMSDLLYESVHDRFWVRADFLGWWTKGFATPPLLTTSPTGTIASEAGVLGAPGTSVVLGGKDLSGGFRPGERLTLGAWLNGCQSVGIEASYFQINPQTNFFNASGASIPILARPFSNSETGFQDSQIVNYPGQQSGVFSSAVASDLQAAEVLIRKNLSRQPDVAVDFLAGYRYQQLEDHLAVDDTLTFSGTQAAFPAGSIVQQSDRFDTRNVFQGGVVGLSTTFQRQGWSLETLLKLGIGQTHSRVAIDGSTTTSIPGQAATTLPGGLLALPSNIGVYDSNRFSAVPELGVTLGFDLSPQLRATIGYDLLYWNSVARPGDQIDLNLDPRQFPPAAGTSATQPAFHLQTSDYWAQGLNLGLDLRF